MNTIIVSLLILIVLFHVFIWIVLGRSLSQMNGWHCLGTHYKWTKAFHGRKWRMQAFSINSVNCSGITIGADTSSMFIGMIFPFWKSVPNLKIPLSEVCGSEVDNLIIELVSLTFHQCPDVTVKIHKKLADKIVNESGGNWRYCRITNPKS